MDKAISEAFGGLDMHNPQKAAQIIAYFAMKSPQKRINILKAMKLVYVADREALKERAWPMLQERRVSMRLGPLNLTTYEYANGERESPEWSSILCDRENHEIGVVDGLVPDSLDELSDAEIDILDKVWAQLGHLNQWQVVEWTHSPENIPEWDNIEEGLKPISNEKLISALELESAKELIELLEDRSRISQMLSQAA